MLHLMIYSFYRFFKKERNTNHVLVSKIYTTAPDQFQYTAARENLPVITKSYKCLLSVSTRMRLSQWKTVFK